MERVSGGTSIFRVCFVTMFTETLVEPERRGV